MVLYFHPSNCLINCKGDSYIHSSLCEHVFGDSDRPIIHYVVMGDYLRTFEKGVRSMIPVFAPNRNYYNEFLKMTNQNKNFFKYVSSEQDLRGVRGQVLIIGDYFINRKYTVGLFHYLNHLINQGLVEVEYEPKPI